MIGGQKTDFYRHTAVKNSFIGGFINNNSLNPYCLAQLWNPADSTILVVCDGVSIFSVGTNAITYSLAHHNAALSSDGLEGNKWIAGPAPAAQVKRDDLAAIPGTVFTTFNQDPTMEKPLNLKQPFIIEPGLGLIVVIASAATKLSVIFTWLEFPYTLA